MKKKSLAVLSLAAAALLAVTGCNGNRGGSDKVELRVAGGYQKPNEAISFQDAEIVGDGLTLSNGKTYHTGDLKPTWEFLSDELSIDFVDKFTGAGSAEKEWGVWENKLNEIDVVAGSVAKLNAGGAQGKLVDLSQHFDKLPNFKKYLEANPIARLSITGQKPNAGGIGAIYFSPYFDGVDDIERMPLIRADMVKKLLDDSNATFDNRAITLQTNHYTPYMPTSGKVEDIRSVGSDGVVKLVTKDYDKGGNIIQRMNEANGLTGNSALEMFKDYIDKTYNGYYEGRRSDLFLGYDAAWDADEMVALFRIARAQLHDKDNNPVVPLFSRETNNMQRDVDMFRFAGSLFGVRGMESRSDYLYFGKDGKVHDARCDEASYKAVERMNALVSEGLLRVDGTAASNAYLQNDAGLMSYDYNQTQTIYNDTIKYEQADGSKKTFAETGREYHAIMVPVAKWDDGDDNTPEYMRFTESWRSVKTDGWAISAAGVQGKPEKLDAALKLIDFAFSVQGQITMSYGPDEFIKVKSTWDKTKKISTWEEVEQKYETFNFNGQQMPVISDGCKTDLTSKASGNYTNFARRYLGSTLNGFPKSQAFEYQCTSKTGQKGSAILAAAIGKGTISHPKLNVETANMWYTSVPTVLPVTAEQDTALKGYTDLTTNFAANKGSKNVFYQIIKGGYEKSGGDTAIGPMNAADFAAKVKSTEDGGWKGDSYLKIRNDQWSTLYAYYQTIAN